ncbi:ABC-type transport auxiliary lipoprotein family protein [Enterovirga sp.]|uniref:ABC-type transport auxiliary lipoprotein family protein n=1 Tax=Enterovirga sp. TaxID=2026350 RepID=UPI00263189F1|nr:ABC-type transport auxiliary lipoprotein family protein [Enterovirga sp.]MDB5591764.1 transporter [Enterovirga sp.]
MGLAYAFALIGFLGACSSPPSPAFDLTAPRQSVRGGGMIGGQLVVAEPTAIQPLEAERILARDAAGSVSYLSGAQWADRLPRLLQARLLQTFENATRIRAVARPGEGVVAQYQLNTDIRAFQLDAARGEAFVEISAKVVEAQSGRIVAARVFSGRTPVPDASGPVVAQGLDRVQSSVLLDIVRWVGTRG